MVWLVVWNIWIIFHILGMSSSQLTFILFRGVAQPPTSFAMHADILSFQEHEPPTKKRGCQGDGSRMSEDMLKSCLALNGVDCVSPT